MQKIKYMLEFSKEILLDACLENGAIVAANLDKPYFPKDVFFYRFVWPRDAAFTLVALDLLDINDIHQKYYDWILHRAEDFNETGLLYQNYHTHGPKHWMNLQPDSNGLSLWAIHHNVKTQNSNVPKKLVQKLADGIISIWSGNKFNTPTQDLWEERLAYPEYDEFHNYSLSTTYLGLFCANELCPNIKYISVANEMKKTILNSYNNNLGFFPRTPSKIVSKSNYCIDASLLSLVFPSGILDVQSPKMLSTLEAIEKQIVKNKGVMRYENDLYCGMIKNNKLLKKGAGVWPLLNFWMSIYYSLKGEKENAKKYYEWVLERIDKYIPEQIFENKVQSSISPLVWSHSMFIIASKHLGYLDNK